MEDLEESVKSVVSVAVTHAQVLILVSFRIVETTGPRMFGLEESEVQDRRRYVAHVRRAVEVRTSS